MFFFDAMDDNCVSLRLCRDGNGCCLNALSFDIIWETKECGAWKFKARGTFRTGKKWVRVRICDVVFNLIVFMMIPDIICSITITVIIIIIIIITIIIIIIVIIVIMFIIIIIIIVIIIIIIIIIIVLIIIIVIVMAMIMVLLLILSLISYPYGGTVNLVRNCN